MLNVSTLRINWICTSEPGNAEDAGNWQSLEGRFTIAPNYRHTVYPDSYKLTAERTGIDRNTMSWNFATVRDCKNWANNIVRAEAEILLHETGRCHMAPEALESVKLFVGRPS